jgi:signal transduction histidine kinase
MTTTGSTEGALAWFLRGRLLERGVLVICAAAVITELAVLLVSGEPPLGYLGLVLVTAGMILGRYHRGAGLTVTVVGAVTGALLSSEFIALWSIVVFQLFSVTVRGTRPIPALLLSVAPLYLAIVAREGWNFQAPVALVATACCAAGAAIGAAVRAQERYLESMRQRALDAEASAHLAVERGVVEERMRIARDLHDVVGHEIAVVNMNLGAAEVQLSSGDAGVKSAIEASRSGIQRILRETQQILDVLRRDQHSDPESTPIASIEQIPDLISTLTSSGASIDATIEDVGDTDPAVSAAAFRIAQEALTNANRYGVGTIRLAMTRCNDELTVEVRNTCAAQLTSGSGYGLIGMRERAESTGGRLTVTQEAGKFAVTATLPAGSDGLS